MKLLPYQEEGVSRILSRSATLLADEMGLGKTAQSLVAFDRSDAKTLLIVCPAYLRLNWTRELALWLHRKPSFATCIVSYDSVHLLERELEFEYVIADEGHYIKNTQTQRYKTIAPFALKAKRLNILTGTPIPDRVRDLWAPLSLLDPKRWNPPPRPHPFANLPSNVIQFPDKAQKEKDYSPNFLTFAKRYCDAKLVTTGSPVMGQRQTWDFTGSSNLRELNRILHETVMVRRLKQDVLKDLPPKRRKLILFARDKDIQDDLVDIEVTEANYDAFVKRLHADKVLFSQWSKTRHDQAVKKVPLVFDYLIDCLDNGVEKLIVFGHHRDVLNHLYQHLQFRGAVMVHGEHSDQERQDAVDVFQQDSSCRFFVGSLGACGTGLNLTVASDVVFSEFDPNPSKLSQGEDRAHRLGQRRLVNVHHLLWEGTLDAKMAKIVVKKQDAIREALA